LDFQLLLIRTMKRSIGESSAASLKRFFWSGCVIICWFSTCMAVAACESVPLGWDASISTNVSGYALYYGTNSGSHPNRIDMGTNISGLVPGLSEGGTYYFVVTSYSASTTQTTNTTSLVTSTGLGTLRSDFTGFAGMEIVVGANPITVTALGRILAAGNGAQHTLKLVNANDGSDVPGGVVSIIMKSGTNGQFQYANLPAPVTLAAGATYFVLTQEAQGGDTWYDINTAVHVSPVATQAGGIWGYGAGQWYSYGSAGESYGPVDFKYVTGTTSSTNTMESLPSNEVSYLVPGVLRMAMNHGVSGGGASAGAALLSFPVAAGHWYEIKATSNLKTWTTIAQTDTQSTNTVIQYQDSGLDASGAPYPQRFYRLLMH
jgi:hypothetical protein